MLYDTNYANKKEKGRGFFFAVKWEVGEDNSSSAFMSLMRIVVILKRLRHFAMRVENEPQ